MLAAEASEQIASRFVKAIETAFLTLLDFPLTGPSREHLGAGLRVMFHRPYAIYYLADHETVLIIRVLHGVRDVSKVAQRGELG